MSHPSQMQFVGSVKDRYPSSFNKTKVLEVGSLNINGTVRDFFADCNYLGVDLGPGAMVDLVCSGHELDHPDHTYDVAISTECFEHNPYWAETFANMLRMTRPGGLIVFTCATTGRPEHGTKRTTPRDAPLVPWDYYQNLTEEDFRAKFSFDDHFLEYKFQTILYPCFDLYFYGIKKN